MLFSIVVPVYNVERYLKECIESIIPQIINLNEGAEIILVDDGSTDCSGIICDQYSLKYPDFIYVYHKKNEGLLLTRRFGFQKAKGEYILNCDSDDVCEDNQISELIKIIKDTDADVIIFNSYILKVNGEKKVLYKSMFGEKTYSLIPKKRVLFEYMYKSSYKAISMCGKIFRRTCLDYNYDYSGYKNLNYGEDTMQSAEIYSYAQSFAYCNKPLYCYRMGSGMTEKYDETFYYQYKEVFNYIENYVKYWDLDDIDKLMALKVFSIVGRSITQTRIKTSMTYQERKEHLSRIREDSLIKKNIYYYRNIWTKLQNSHKIICSLFLNKQYRMIDALLRLKNILFKITKIFKFKKEGKYMGSIG